MSAVVREAANAPGEVTDLSGIAQSCLAHERLDAIAPVVAHDLAVPEEPCDQAVQVIGIAAKVEQVERASRLEHADHLVQGRQPHVRVKMVEHEGRQHPVEAGVGIREFVREAAIELERKPGSARLAIRAP